MAGRTEDISKAPWAAEDSAQRRYQLFFRLCRLSTNRVLRPAKSLDAEVVLENRISDIASARQRVRINQNAPIDVANLDLFAAAITASQFSVQLPYVADCELIVNELGKR